MADEAMSMLRAMMKGVVVDDETLAVDVIRDVGPGGGTYLGHPHTYNHFREYWQPTLTRRMNYETWVKAGSQTLGDRVKDRLRNIMDTHQPKPLPATARAKIDEIVEKARVKATAVPA